MDGDWRGCEWVDARFVSCTFVCERVDALWHLCPGIEAIDRTASPRKGCEDSDVEGCEVNDGSRKFVIGRAEQISDVHHAPMRESPKPKT